MATLPVCLKDLDAFYHVDDHSTPLPDQPNHVGPIFDPVRCGEPLPVFDILTHASAFGERSHLDSEACVPACPETFSDRYLYPTLAENEHTRLTMFWYYTKGLNEDTVLLQKLDQMLELTKQSLGWDVGIIGMLDAQTFTRLVAANMSLATIPRRESTCSHTANQPPGTVFMITDMSQDWRFKHSPAVEGDGGLRSYAGTPIRYTLPNGEVVVFGSLCVASGTVQKPLTEDQKRCLIRAADMITGELVTRTRTRRLRERQIMMDVLMQLRADDSIADIEEITVQALFRRYPGSHVAIAKIQDHSVVVEDRASISLPTVNAGLWEDTDFIRSMTESKASEVSDDKHTVRAIVHQIGPRARVLLVASADLKLVFDDLDSWFVDQCAQIINSVSQARALKEALAAKEKFLRSVTHELRTPIHGILSSVELLSEEMAARKMLRSNMLQESDREMDSLLRTISLSGTELMTTVNNMLRMNTLTGDNIASHPTDYDLLSLETDVLGEAFTNKVPDQFPGLSLYFEHTVPKSMTTVSVDADLLKELLKCLVANAIAATKDGSVKVVSSIVSDQKTLRFDVIDTGTGISSVDQQRIFIAFEKLALHSSGSGLGLNLASQMACMLNGTLSVVSSQLGVGSHFRLEIPYIVAALRPTMSDRKHSSNTRHIPATYYVAPSSKRNLHLFSHLQRHLVQRGMVQSDVAQGALIITNQPEPFQEMLDGKLRSLHGPHLIILVSDTVATEYSMQCLRDDLKPHLGFPITGPLYTARLEEILAEADRDFATYCKQFPTSPWNKDTQLATNLNGVQINSSNVAPTKSGANNTEIEIFVNSSPPPLRAQIVDDNAINLSVLQYFCKARKIPYGTATNGNKAFTNFCSAASTEPYTLVLMDLQMPECDGVEACKRIREYEKQQDLRPSIIFMITGQDSLADRKNSFDAGVDDFFVKPVSLKKLDLAITQSFPRSPP